MEEEDRKRNGQGGDVWGSAIREPKRSRLVETLNLQFPRQGLRGCRSSRESTERIKFGRVTGEFETQINQNAHAFQFSLVRNRY